MNRHSFYDGTNASRQPICGEMLATLAKEQTKTPGERMRVAQAAIVEREHLARVKAQLVPQLGAATERVNVLARELQKEQADVDRLGNGVMGFLNELRGGQMTREQLELQTAAAKLREAVAMRDAKRDQLIALDRRVAELAHADAELAAARAEKERLLLGGDSPIKAELEELDIQMMSIDIELVPLREAVVAGHAALAALAELVTMLDTTPNKKHIQATRGHAGETEAKLRLFETELGDLAGLPIDVPATHPGDDELDDWIVALLKSGDRETKLAAGRTDLSARIARLRTRLETVRARHDELAVRHAAILAKRSELIANS